MSAAPPPASSRFGQRAPSVSRAARPAANSWRAASSHGRAAAGLRDGRPLPRNVNRGEPVPEVRASRPSAMPAAPPVRIRTVLAVALVAGLGAWVVPRGLAAWRLQTVATELADYALCMVGPTGPALIRDNVSEFQRLVRRRLVASAANER